MAIIGQGTSFFSASVQHRLALSLPSRAGEEAEGGVVHATAAAAAALLLDLCIATAVHAAQEGAPAQVREGEWVPVFLPDPKACQCAALPRLPVALLT